MTTLTKNQWIYLRSIGADRKPSTYSRTPGVMADLYELDRLGLIDTEPLGVLIQATITPNGHRLLAERPA